MTTTKQLNSHSQSRQANGGKTYAMQYIIPDSKPINELNAGEFRALITESISAKKVKPVVKIDPSDTVEVGGVTYGMNDMVTRDVALEISTFNTSNFSTKITEGEIKAHGRGKQTRFKVADCVRLRMSKHSRKKSA